MGNWNITIRGVGCHHNGKPEIDANMQAAEFVKLLKKSGHAIASATITYGGEETLDPVPYEGRLCATSGCNIRMSEGSPVFCPIHNDQNTPTP